MWWRWGGSVRDALPAWYIQRHGVGCDAVRRWRPVSRGLRVGAASRSWPGPTWFVLTSSIAPCRLASHRTRNYGVVVRCDLMPRAMVASRSCSVVSVCQSYYTRSRAADLDLSVTLHGTVNVSLRRSAYTGGGSGYYYHITMHHYRQADVVIVPGTVWVPTHIIGTCHIRISTWSFGIMPGTVTNYGERWMLDLVRLAATTHPYLELRLLRLAVTITEDMTWDDGYECDFAGYSRRTLYSWTPVQTNQGIAETDASSQQYTLTATPGQSIYGYVLVVGGTDDIVSAELFGTPVPLAEVGDQITIQVRLRMRSEM